MQEQPAVPRKEDIQMPVEENKAVARRWNEEIFNGRQLEAFDEVLHQDHTNRGGSDSSWAPTIQGLTQAKTYCMEMFQRDSNLQVSVEDIIGEGDKVAVRGTYYREGKPVGNLIAFYRFSGGKIVDDWPCTRWLKD
jgi:ketosteroid isomerase-like protein